MPAPREIVIKCTWKEEGPDFRRPDQLVRFLRDSLPKVVARGDIEKLGVDAQMLGTSEELAQKAIAHIKAGELNSAIAILSDPPKPEGWDDFFLHLRYEIQLQ